MKTKIYLFLLLAVMLVPWAMPAQAQEINLTTQIGAEPASGTTPLTSPYIVLSNYAYSVSQFLIDNYEIQGGSQTINSLDILMPSGQASFTRNITIYLKHYLRSDYDYPDIYYPVASSDAVFSGNITFHGGWNTISFTTPFQYYGTQNLVITFDDNTGSATSGTTRYVVRSLSSRHHAPGTEYENSWKSSFFGNSTSDLDPTTQLELSEFGYSPIRPVIRLHGTQSPYALPYSQNFNTSPYEKPDGWQIPDLQRFNFGVSTDGFGTGSGVTTGHSGTGCFKFTLLDRTTYYGSNCFTPWFRCPASADSIRITLWFANSRPGSTQKIPLYVAVQKASYESSGSNTGDIFPTSVRAVTQAAQTTWTQVSATFPTSRVGYENFRLMIGDWGNNTTDIGGALLIDDLTVEAVHSNLPHDLFFNDYFQDFDGYSTYQDAGWDFLSSTPTLDICWTINSNYYSATYPTSAHSGNSALYCKYQERDYRNRARICSPAFIIPGDRAAQDSVIVDFWYANPNWGGDVDSMQWCFYRRPGNSIILNNSRTARITEAHDDWTHYRLATPANQLPDTFWIELSGCPQYGYGLHVDDFRVSYKRMCNIQAVASPAYAGTVTGGGLYQNQDVVYLTATPAPGHTFLYWQITAPNWDLTWEEPTYDAPVSEIYRNVTFTAVFSSEHDLALGPYSEDFESQNNLEDFGWTTQYRRPSTLDWEPYTLFSERIPPYAAHSGNTALRCYLANNSGQYVVNIYSPKFLLPDYRNSQDSVIIEFWYANPTWSDNYDSMACYIYDASINTRYQEFAVVGSHDIWTHFRQALPAVHLSDSFWVFLRGKPRWGYGMYVDDIQVTYKRMIPIQAVATPSEGGIVTGSGLYVKGDQVSISATPASGYTFQHWTVYSDSLAPYLIPLYTNNLGFMADENFQNATFTAVFTPEIPDLGTDTVQRDIDCPSYWVQFQPNSFAYGTCTSPSWASLQYGTRFESLAIPRPGCHFVKWSDGSTANPLVVNHIDNTTLREAFFLPDSPITATVPWRISFDTCAQWNTPNGIIDINSYTPQATKPMVVDGWLRCSNTGAFMLPQFDQPVNTLELSFDYKLSYGQLIVGVATDPENMSTFTSIEIINPSETESHYTLDLSSYSGQGGYIVFQYGIYSSHSFAYSEDNLLLRNIEVVIRR